MIELLIVVAIIGILASVGIVSFSGILGSVKDKEGQNGLQSIYLAQTEYKSLNKIYFIGSGGCGDQTNNINTNLFNGDKTINNENFRFCITGNSNGYTARAYSKNNNDNFYITNKNEKNFWFNYIPVTAEPALKIGKYIATSNIPIRAPIITIAIGSIIVDKFFTTLSNSSS